MQHGHPSLLHHVGTTHAQSLLLRPTLSNIGHDQRMYTASARHIEQPVTYMFFHVCQVNHSKSGCKRAGGKLSVQVHYSHVTSRFN